ncbi:MAG: hypothetical protein M1343_01130 [Chloroflexi bacterium]|nr:hypothetical protein [Chloroflexota bacterium]MDA8187870.1 hypothetical protein [Dehalococcoidales bacterium]
MCKINPVTKGNIEEAKSGLLKRMANPNLTHEQLLVLMEQYDYIVNNVRERAGYDPASAAQGRAN